MRVRLAVIAPACLVACIFSSLALGVLGVLGVLGGPAAAQENEVDQGHHLATLICSACHVAAPDQDFEPILRPPAPPFVSIAERRDLTADYLQTFLSTTHRDVLNPKGMPNPLLLDYQIKQISAYILSLRKRS
jgi:mono/diheme cytochrome c family protein